MTEHKHTPLPWKIEPPAAGDCVTWICSDHHNINQARQFCAPIPDAAFIVSACNSHYELVEALENLMAMVSTLTGPDDAIANAAISMGWDALAKAKGET